MMSGQEGVICPACHSRVSADGNTVLEKSGRLRELEVVPGRVSKLRAEVEALERKVAGLVKAEGGAMG